MSVSRRFVDVAIGQELPELVVELTPTLIVAGAIASRDYQDVHHDLEEARARGMPGIPRDRASSTSWCTSW